MAKKTNTWFCVFTDWYGDKKRACTQAFRLHMPEDLLAEKLDGKDLYCTSASQTDGGYECIYEVRDENGNFRDPGRMCQIVFQRIPIHHRIYERELLVQDFNNFHCVKEGHRFLESATVFLMPGIITMLINQQ